MRENSDKKYPSHIINLPIIIALTLAGGIFIGAKMFGSNTSANDTAKGSRKFSDILNIINSEYVDTVNTDQLVENAINKMLEDLDPHSAYIPAKDLSLAKSQLEGDFEGIGIEFHILKDTIYVVAPISGGPSEQVGLKSGDKIIEVDDKKACGINLTIQDVFGMLRGKKGTKVKVKILRKGTKGPLNFTITRDKIPTFSVDVSYMVDDSTGYIKVSRFSANTFIEFKEALTKLKGKGLKRLLLDLRENPGGYMDRATKMVDELLDGQKLIVYTESKEDRYDSRIYAGVAGEFEKGPIIVMVSEGSASASEIVSGALQDNDRALIVGRRTFGKGLVQMPIPMSDGSELRLTISRYYTPSGRSIQKPYSKNEQEYEMDIVKRYKHGEFFYADSIKFDEKLKYKTSRGRTVYGGGGIMPDVFVPRDTSMYTPFMLEVFNKGLLREFTLDYVAEHKKELETMGFEAFRKSFNVETKVMPEFLAAAKKSGIKYNDKDYAKSKALLVNQIKAFIARGVWKNEGFYPIYNELDEMFSEAMKQFGRAANLEKGKF